MTCDEEDLEKLGFVDGSQFYPHHAWDNLSIPVLVSAVSDVVVVVVIAVEVVVSVVVVVVFVVVVAPQNN